MKFSIREIIFILVLAGIPMGAYWWVFRPANDHIESQRQDMEAKAQKLDELRRAAQGIESLDAEVQNLSEAVGFFQSKLPYEHEIHKVLEQVARIAENHDLETKLFKTSKSKSFAAYSEQPIKMEIRGKYDDYYKFLLELERMPRITKVTEMEIKSTDPVTGSIEANFTLNIFFATGKDQQAESSRT